VENTASKPHDMNRRDLFRVLRVLHFSLDDLEQLSVDVRIPPRMLVVLECLLGRRDFRLEFWLSPLGVALLSSSLDKIPVFSATMSSPANNTRLMGFRQRTGSGEDEANFDPTLPWRRWISSSTESIGCV